LSRTSEQYEDEWGGAIEPITVGGWLNEYTIGLNPELSQVHGYDETGAGQALNTDNESGVNQ